MRVFLTDRGVEKGYFDNNTSHYRTIKDWMKTDRERELRRYPRYVLLNRAYRQHLLRLKHNSLNIPMNSPLTSAESIRILLDDLLKLSMSAYAEVRWYDFIVEV